jgi:uncharacterized protein (DUF4213/DUF364 family)
MHGIAHSYVELVERIVSALGSRRVSDVHLPPEVEQRSKDAEFCALELDDGSIGLSYVWLGETFPMLRESPHIRNVIGEDALVLARGYAGNDPVLRTLGFAAINALSQHLFARAGFLPEGTTNSIGLLEPRAGDHIGMVGLFPPLVDPILATGARLTVAELRPELAREAGRLRVVLDIHELEACNKVISTSTVLLNDTLDSVLAACSGAACVAIIGPGAGCLPDPLFARGVDTIGGARILDRKRFAAALARGDSWGSAAQKYCIRRDGYPGIEQLIERAAADLRS